MGEAKEQNNKQPKGKGAGPTRSFDGLTVGPGGQIGSFRIERELGRGGAGVVYLAHDTKLDRSVAIKSLPAELMKNPKARTRFAREARVLASLNHPNIGTIYEELEEAEGVGYLVLEYVPGQTLAERIASARLKPQEALSIAQQIAEAVAAAHEHDVIHRDLKPGNIKITPEGKVKVLDFGLAKALGAEATDQQSTVTEPGRIIGTPAYMSPEQARGQETDKRCDIWSFGCVLYEMLTGKVPFEGETVSDTLAAILDRDPDWHALPQATPGNIQILLRRCLEKDPRQRLRDIGDASIEIHETLDLPAIVKPSGVPSIRSSRRTLWKVAALYVFAGLVVCAVAVLVVMRGPTQPPEPGPTSRWPITLDPDNPLRLHLYGIANWTFTPNGLELIYVTGTAEDNTWLVRRPLDSLHAERIKGTDGAVGPPKISPNGRWLAFTAQDAAWIVPLAGGEPEKIVENSFNITPIWEDNNTLILGTIVFSSGGLSRFNLKTKERVALTRMDHTEGYYMHVPIDLHLETGTLFFIKARGPDPINFYSFALSLETGEIRPIVEHAFGWYLPSGHLIYSQRGRLMAASFDIETLQMTSDAINVTEERMATSRTAPNFVVSPNGTLIYVPIEGERRQDRELVWVDHKGKEEPLKVPPQEYESVRVSGDMTHPQVAVAIRGSIWIYDAGDGTQSLQLTFSLDGWCQIPVWMVPDNREIVFYCTESGVNLLKRKAADGTGEAEAIPVKDNRWAWYVPMCSTDRKMLLALAPGSEETEAWTLVGIHLDGKVEHLLNCDNNEGYFILSPDEKWLAYQCKEKGREEVFVTKYPSFEGRWRISIETEGGREPIWAHDGKTIYYRDGAKLVAIPVETEGGFRRGEPQFLFDDVYEISPLARTYDIHPDGTRFLMIKKVGEQEQAPITELILVENWFEELKRRVPTGKKQ